MSLFTCSNYEAQAVDEGVGVCAVLRGAELVPDAGLLQGQTQTGKSPLQVHTQRQLVLEQAPHYHLSNRGKNRSKHLVLLNYPLFFFFLPYNSCFFA